MKRILSMLICIFMIASLTACGSGADNGKKPLGTKVDSSLKKGELASVGDVFKLPDVKQAAGAPTLAELTKQAYPGDSIIVSGEGFKSAGVKFYVYAQNTKDNGKANEAKFTVIDDNYASVLIDEKLPYGVYGIYAENASGTSNIKTVNKPAIWDIGLYKLTAGESLTVLGENLTTDNGNKSHAYLVSEDGKEYCEASITFAGPGKIEFTIPEGLKVGAKYKVRIHNGHGGDEGFAVSEGSVEYLKETAIQYNGKVVDVTDYKADPLDRTNDDTSAIEKAVKNLKDGDTLYFPPGSYLVSQAIKIEKDIRMLGAGADKTTIYGGYNIENSVFSLTSGYAEITGITFEQMRTKGKIKASLITFTGNAVDEGKYKLYIHDNVFNQYVTGKSRSYKYPISVYGTYGVRVENNKYDATCVFYASRCRQVHFKNNEAFVSTYAGVYYGSSAVFITNVDVFDGSFNKIYGKGATDKKTGAGAVNVDEFAAGRVFVFQGFARNTYVCNNELVRVGLIDCNAGEIILYEQFDWLYNGNAVKSTADTIEVSQQDRNKTVVDSVISVLEGKGKGQYRVITKRTGNVFTVDRPWDILPDATSTVVVTNCYINGMIRDNYMDGYTNWQSHPSSTVGLNIYGAFQNMFYCNNDIKNVIELVSVTSFYWFYNMYDTICPVSWSQFDGNTCESSGVGVNFNVVVNDKSGAIPFAVCFGNTARKNTFKDIRKFDEGTGYDGGYGIRVGSRQGTKTWVGEWCTGNIIEANTFDGCATANIQLGPHQGKNVFRANKALDGTAPIKVESAGFGAPIEAAY